MRINVFLVLLTLTSGLILNAYAQDQPAPASPETLEELDRWVRDTHPDWHADDIRLIMDGIAAALDETSAPLRRDERHWLISQTADYIAHGPLSAGPIVPSKFPFFVAAYRHNLENHLTRTPMTAEETALLTSQIDQVLQYGKEQWASIGASRAESTAHYFDDVYENVSWRMRSPFTSTMKAPFTEAQMARIFSSMDQEAQDFLDGLEQPDADFRRLAETYTMFLFDGIYSEMSAPPITEKMKELYKQVEAESVAWNKKKLQDRREANIQRRAAESAEARAEMDEARRVTREMQLARAEMDEARRVTREMQLARARAEQPAAPEVDPAPAPVAAVVATDVAPAAEVGTEVAAVAGPRWRLLALLVPVLVLAVAVVGSQRRKATWKKSSRHT